MVDEIRSIHAKTIVALMSYIYFASLVMSCSPSDDTVTVKDGNVAISSNLAELLVPIIEEVYKNQSMIHNSQTELLSSTEEFNQFFIVQGYFRDVEPTVGLRESDIIHFNDYWRNNVIDSDDIRVPLDQESLVSYEFDIRKRYSVYSDHLLSVRSTDSADTDARSILAITVLMHAMASNSIFVQHSRYDLLESLVRSRSIQPAILDCTGIDGHTGRIIDGIGFDCAVDVNQRAILYQESRSYAISLFREVHGIDSSSMWLQAANSMLTEKEYKQISTPD